FVAQDSAGRDNASDIVDIALDDPSPEPTAQPVRRLLEDVAADKPGGDLPGARGTPDSPHGYSALDHGAEELDGECGAVGPDFGLLIAAQRAPLQRALDDAPDADAGQRRHEPERDLGADDRRQLAPDGRGDLVPGAQAGIRAGDALGHLHVVAELLVL